MGTEQSGKNIGKKIEKIATINMEKRIMDLRTNGFQDSGWKSDIDKQRGVDVCINRRGKQIKSCE